MIYGGISPDVTLNGYLATIRDSAFGRDAREAIAMSVQRCYQVAKLRVGGSSNVPQQQITDQTTRIRIAKYGEEVRDALQMGLRLCYQTASVNVSSIENTYFTDLAESCTGEDLKNSILRCIVQCCLDVH